VLGILGSLPETARRKLPFDFVGFAALSLAVGALQLMLDRGQLKDWWGSPEICVEAAVAAVFFYLFVIHMLTARGAQFISPALFKDRNFLTGNLFIFFIGVVMFATLALLPPLLQNLLGYPVVTTGLVTAPRGVGTLAAMFLIGRVMRWVDARLIIAAGLAMTSLSMWQMSGFDLQMDSSTVVISGIVQGFGIGFLYVPMASVTFATLAPALRNEGTALFSLTRNLGSSIGISAVETLLTRNAQINHATLAEHLTPYSAIIRAQAPHGAATLHSLTRLNAAVSEQAAMIAYNNNFKLMMLLSLAAIPLTLLLKKAGAPATGSVVIE